MSDRDACTGRHTVGRKVEGAHDISPAVRHHQLPRPPTHRIDPPPGHGRGSVAHPAAQHDQLFGETREAFEGYRPACLLQEHAQTVDRVQGPGQHGQLVLESPRTGFAWHVGGVEVRARARDHPVPDEARDRALGGIVPAEPLEVPYRKPLVGDQGPVGGVANPGEAVLHLEGVAGEGLEVRRIAHLAGAFAGAACRPEMGAVGGEGAQLAGRAVQHGDGPGGEAGGAADLGEEVCVRAFEQSPRTSVGSGAICQRGSADCRPWPASKSLWISELSRP